MQYDRMRIFDIYWHIINIYIYIYPYIFIYIYTTDTSLSYIYTHTRQTSIHILRDTKYMCPQFSMILSSLFVTFFFAAAV